MRKVGKFAFIMLVMATGCSGPTRDQSTLRAIHAEARTLIGTSSKSVLVLPKRRWPEAIMSLKPENVTISADGVDILIRPFFDGGSGYFIPFKDGVLPEPTGRFEPVGQGVYWYQSY
jgi:hypothetical protein